MIKMTRGKQIVFLRSTRVARCRRLTQNMGTNRRTKGQTERDPIPESRSAVECVRKHAMTSWVADCDHRLAGTI